MNHYKREIGIEMKLYELFLNEDLKLNVLITHYLGI